METKKKYCRDCVHKKDYVCEAKKEVHEGRIFKKSVGNFTDICELFKEIKR